jgi:hypothetical protein
MTTDRSSINSHSGRQRAASREKGLLFVGAALAIVGMLFAAAPAFAQQMDAVRGPLATQAPGPFYEATLRGPVYSIKSEFVRVKSWTYTDGETLKGKCEWSTASSAGAQASSATDNNSTQTNLAAVWDLVGGPGYYATHVAGSKILRGTFTGDKGTILTVESLDNFVAVGADNRGNIYKIVW